MKPIKRDLSSRMFRRVLARLCYSLHALPGPGPDRSPLMSRRAYYYWAVGLVAGWVVFAGLAYMALL